MDESKDRTRFQPSHEGTNILPNTPFLAQFLRHAHKHRLAIRDDNAGIERTYGQLIADALTLRSAISAKLPRKILDDIERGHEVFIGVLAPGGYEYAVAVIAIYALGAAIVPMTTALPPREAAYFVHKSRQVAILTSRSARPLADATVSHLATTSTTFPSPAVIDIAPNLLAQHPSPSTFLLSSNRALDDNAPGLVIFTSGTSGPPKGAVHRRSFISEDTRATAEHFELGPQDVLLHILPVHHATGAMINFFPFLASGACIEFRSGGFDAEWLWERWRMGGLTVFSGVPTVYMRMMRHYSSHISQLPAAERQAFEDGANNLRIMLCGTSALPRPLQEFWTRIRKGKIIHTRYGSTEVGAIFKVPLDPTGVPDGSVGEVAPGVDVRLSEGAEGEILVKSPYMMSKYLYDNEATAKAFDAEGYFKTGDIARRDGKWYTIVGRASQDIIKTGGYKISALDIERECLSLPYIAEAMCVGVDDAEFGQRVGVVVSLRDDQDVYASTAKKGKQLLNIGALRDDLSERLARYKMPTLLRVVEGELPKTASGKVLKRVLGPQLLPSPGWDNVPEVQAWHPSTSAGRSKL